MITGVTAVAPSGDGGPIRLTVSTAASSQSSSSAQTTAESSAALAKPESSSAGSSTQDQQQGQHRERGGDSAATSAYLASLLAASITGRSPEGARPSKITPERLSTLITYLESTVAATAPSRSEGEHAVDVKS